MAPSQREGTPSMAIALMGLGRDLPFLEGAVKALRAQFSPEETVLCVLIDQVTELQTARLGAADPVVASPKRSGFARARRRSLLNALSFEPDAVLVCDGDGQFGPEAIVQIAQAW